MSARSSIFNPSLPVASSAPSPTPNPNSPTTSDYHTAASASPEDDDEDEDEGDPFGNSGDENTHRRWGDMEDTKSSVKGFNGILKSLDWYSHQNIGNHLLQAHVLKKLYPHGVLISQEKKRKLGYGSDDDIEAMVDPNVAARKRFITKQWTAWPMPADRVPREKEHLPSYVFFQQRRRVNDVKSFAARQEEEEVQAPSEMLEKVLTAVVLRKAKERIRARNNPALKPAYDDEESEKLLKPAVRNVIARLDTLLLGLHQEREHYVKRLIPSAEGGDAKRKWDRVKVVPEMGELTTPPDTTAASPTPDHSDSQEEGSVAKKKKKKKRRIQTPEEYALSLKDRMSVLKMRDWSHVMGMAAIKGWDEEPLQKAAKGCAELFGGDMGFRTLGVGAGKAGIAWSAKEGLREDPPRFKDESNFLEPVKVSWGGKKRGAQEAKEKRRMRMEEMRRRALEEDEDEEDEEEEEEEEEEDDDDGSGSDGDEDDVRSEEGDEEEEEEEEEEDAASD
ncbi:hypothetical protein K440DRAFT_664402 [Wilcoxina mikolae CBS 423.85]|nr:hypothetical protein K440DRAFT_664402 [Wilcoxina mikolae CBS 423.85]